MTSFIKFSTGYGLQRQPFSFKIKDDSLAVSDTANFNFMRKQPFTIDSYVHVYNRGNRKTEIVRAVADNWRFLQSLRFFNDSHSSTHILRQLELAGLAVSDTAKPTISREFESVFEMGWPPNWPEKDPLVKILSYCLMPNHFHLLLKEIRKGGISKFMQKLGIGYTNYFNLKYQEVGKVFQGGYKAKLVNEEMYLKYLCIYIQVINVLELFPGGLKTALKSPKDAMKFVDDYPFSSHLDYAGLRKSLIIDKDVLGEFLPTSEDYRKFAHDSVIAKDFYQILEKEDLRLE